MAGRSRAAAKGLALVGLMASGALLQAQPAASPGPATSPSGTSAPQSDTDRQLVETACTACHDIGQVTAQHLSSEDWAATVDKMIGLGAQISDADRGRIIAYLAAHQGPQNARSEPCRPSTAAAFPCGKPS